MSSLRETFTILAIETSCDETAAAIVRDGTEIVTNVVASQIDEHRRYGGIVPEVASRQHILTMVPVIEEALSILPDGLDSVDAIAATYGPGLSGALLTGLNIAKAIAWGRNLPFVGVNHIEAHIYANWLTTTPTNNDQATKAPEPPQFPIIALVVSGGHTMLVLLEDHGRYQILGQTRDDAAGEAFDKVARIMGLGFPGGPAIQEAAANAPGGVTLPRAWLRDTYDFSFSGLKTAALHHVQNWQEREARLTTPQRTSKNDSVPPKAKGISPHIALSERYVAQLAYAFQESVVDVLVTKTINAARAFAATEILLAGGVAANQRLREEMSRRASVPVRYPPVSLCTDNAAMVAAAAFYRFDAGLQSGWDLDVQPNLKLASSGD